MLKILKQLKTLNRQRISNRRNAKFLDELSNDFDKSHLQLNALKPLIAKTETYKQHLKASNEFAVYSTYFGTSKTKTFNNAKIDSNFDHFFISNNEKILKMAESKGWHPIFLGLPISTNLVLSSHQSKVPKALPHFFPALKNYGSLLYVDDKLDFSANEIYKLSKGLIQNNFALMVRAHPSLTKNILNELSVAMIQPRYQAQRDQVVSYIDQQIKNGRALTVENLFLTGAILRNMLHAETEAIGEDWYQGILQCGIECQISFDFVAQKYKSIALLPQIT